MAMDSTNKVSLTTTGLSAAAILDVNPQLPAWYADVSGSMHAVLLLQQQTSLLAIFCRAESSAAHGLG